MRPPPRPPLWTQGCLAWLALAALFALAGGGAVLALAGLVAAGGGW
jgi:hypothetical protein